MKRFGFLFLVALFVGGGLGGCSSVMDYTSDIGGQQAYRIGGSVTPKTGHAATPKDERVRLIRMLTRIEHTHRRDALQEIEAR